MLKRFDIESDVKDTFRGDNIQKLLSIEIDMLLRFNDKIGFRYCYHKIHRLSVASSFFKLRKRIEKQRKDILELTKYIISTENLNIKYAYNKAKEQYKNNNIILNDYYSIGNYWWIHDIISNNKEIPKRQHFTLPHFYSIQTYLEEFGALQLFVTYDENNKKIKKPTYAVNFTSDVFPVIEKRVIAVE